MERLGVIGRWSAVGGMRDGAYAGDVNVVHQTNGNLLLAFQCGTRSPGREGQNFPGPQGWDQPFDGVAGGMAFSDDVALLVDLVSFGGDDFARHGNVAVRESDAVELNLQITLAHKMSGLLVGFQMAAEIAAARKYGLAKLAQGGEVANHRIANVCRRRREIRFIERAAQQRARGHKNI